MTELVKFYLPVIMFHKQFVILCDRSQRCNSVNTGFLQNVSITEGDYLSLSRQLAM
jgi:hypothetical protein